MRFVYSDTNFILMGEIVHRKTGKMLDELTQEEVFKPLGMTDTQFKPPASLRGRIAPTEIDAATGQPTPVRGIAFGGLHGLKRVLFSADGGQNWTEAALGKDYGKYSFRQWQTTVQFPQGGSKVLMARAVDTAGQMQPLSPNWNGSGFLRNVVETVDIQVVA